MACNNALILLNLPRCTFLPIYAMSGVSSCFNMLNDYDFLVWCLSFFLSSLPLLLYFLISNVVRNKDIDCYPGSYIYIPQTRNCHCVGLLYNLSYMYARLTNKKNTNLSVWSPKRNEAFPFHCIKKFA